MRKTTVADTQAYYTQHRTSFLKHHKQPKRCTAEEFKCQVAELRRLQVIVQSGDKPRRMDNYDRMIHLNRIKTSEAAELMSQQLADASLATAELDLTDEETTPTAVPRRSAMVLPPKTTLPRTLSSSDTSFLDPNLGASQNVVGSEPRSGGEGSTRGGSRGSSNGQSRGDASIFLSSGAGASSATRRRSAAIAQTRYSRPEELMSVLSGGRIAQTATAAISNGQPLTGPVNAQELLSSIMMVIQMLKGKSRLKQDMLMKEFAAHSDDGSCLTQAAFKHFMLTKGVREPFLIQRLFKAVDQDSSGQINFAEFKRSVQLLKGDIGQRVGIHVKMFDVSNTGSLNAHEVGMLLGVGLPHASREDVDGFVSYLFDHTDINQSGSLTQEDIVAGIHSNSMLRDLMQQSIV